MYMYIPILLQYVKTRDLSLYTRWQSNRRTLNSAGALLQWDSTAAVRPDATRRGVASSTRPRPAGRRGARTHRGCRVPASLWNARQGMWKRKGLTGRTGKDGGRTLGVAAQPAAPSKAPAPLEPAKRIPDDDDDGDAAVAVVDARRPARCC